ncbi:MAG: response regulator [Hespellia sp.]|nr:response regulator [Hespellia sp.]
MEFNNVQELLTAVIQAYYYERNIEATLACVADDIEWIGTEEEDCASGKDQLRILLEADVNKFPDPFEIEMDEPSFQKLGDDAVLISIIGKQVFTSVSKHGFTIRGTACCVRGDRGWLVKNVHTSTPNARLEKYRLEQKIREIHKKEQVLMASIPGGVAIYRIKKDGKVTTDYVSESLAKMCDYQADEFLAYLRENAIVNLVQEDVPEVMKHVMESLEKGTSINVTYRIYNKAQEEILIRLDANVMPETPLEEGDVAVLYAVHTVVSEEAKQEKREQNHYRTIMNMLGIAYWEWSKENGFYASKKYYNYLLSKSPLEDVKNNRVFEPAVYPEDVSLLKEFFNQTDYQEDHASVIVRMGMADGTYHWTEIFGFKEYASSGEQMGMSCVMRDVDKEWLEQNEKLEKALKQAQAALAKAKKADDAKDEFLSRMSHDLRTPMNAVIGLSALTLDEADHPETVRENMTKMRLASDFMLGLINDILDMAKIESGAVTLYKEPYAYQDFVVNMKTMFQAQCEQKGITFVMPEYTCNPLAYVDKVRINQIFFNIISNAIKYTPSGGTISYEIKNLKFDGSTASADCVISDNGIGISEEFQAHLFEPFMQESDRVTPELQGSGLGLSITKKLVELMGGEIHIESKKGEGTSVTVHMTLEIMSMNAHKAHITEVDPEKMSSILKGKRILLVEDHPLNTHIAKALLEKKQMSVSHAENGQRAVEMFEASPVGNFDVILMDIRMPIMSGLDATREIRALARKDARKVPIIAMTANAYDEDVKKSRKAGMNEHLSKPIDPEKLYETLAKYISGGSLD